MIVYKITNTINDKCYVGQTKNKINTRILKHFSGVGSIILNAAIEKYGKENFVVEVLSECESVEHLNTLESFYIRKFRSLSPYGYNIRDGGGAGHACSEELKKIISAKTKEGMSSTEVRAKISKAKKGKKGSFTIFKKGHQIGNKAIYCVQTGKQYKNQLDAALDLGVSKSAISSHLSGRLLSVKNLTFKRVEVKNG